MLPGHRGFARSGGRRLDDPEDAQQERAREKPGARPSQHTEVLRAPRESGQTDDIAATSDFALAHLHAFVESSFVVSEQHPAPDPKRGQLEVGSLFAGRYRIVAKLGQGGMAAVYRAKDKLVGETVALKVSTGSVDEDSDYGEEQRREVALARKVTHPNVARVYDLGFSGGALFVTMELVEGKALNLRAMEGHLPLEEVVQVGRQLASALSVAHEAGVLHLDLKPQNVMVAEGRVPRAVLVDFGIAQALGTVATGYGTPDYVSPEQVAKETLTGASDIFSLGVMLYELLVRRRPFKGDSSAVRALARLTEPARPLPETVPRAIASVVHRMLERQPDVRPSAKELEGVFCAALDSLPHVGSVATLAPAVDAAPPPPSPASPAPAPSALEGEATVVHGRRDDESGPRLRVCDLVALPDELGAALAFSHRKLANTGSEARAISVSEAALAHDPRHPVALSIRALALTRSWNLTAAGRLEDIGETAADAVADALRFAGHLPDTHLADALIADYSGDTAYAVRALERALAIDPLHSFSHLILGRIEIEAGHGGFERLRLSCALDPTQVSTYALASREHYFRGEVDEALRMLDEADRNVPDSNETLSLRARIALWNRDEASAAAVSNKLRPNAATIHRIYFEMLKAVGDPSKLEPALALIGSIEAIPTTPKRRAFLYQIWAELCGAFGRPEGLRYLVNAAQLPLSDLRWLDGCPALDFFRAEPAFKYARSLVEDRVDHALFPADRRRSA